jgi:hypothetical protein
MVCDIGAGTIEQRGVMALNHPLGRAHNPARLNTLRFAASASLANVARRS